MLRPVDICIVTQLHPSSNPRVVKEADALTDAGYSVAVIAPNFSAWGLEADEEFERRNWRIVERPQFGPLSPTWTRIAELTRRTLCGFAVRKLGVNHPAVVRAAWSPVAPLLVHAAKRQPASVYIGHLVGLPAAAIAAAHNGAKYAFDAEDFHPGDLPDTPQHKVENWMVRLIEGCYLPDCAYMTAASPGIADAYEKEYGIPKPTVVLNTFPVAQAPLEPTAAGAVTPGPSIYWFSQTIGADRGLQAAVRAIGLASCKPHLYLRGDPAPGIVEELQIIAGQCNVSAHLHFLPMAPPNDMVTLAAGYDVGLCSEIGHTPNRRIALTNKQFTYLLAGIPALMSDISAHSKFAEEATGAVDLFKVDDASSLAQSIDRILESPERLKAMRKRCWELGQQRFNWAIDAERLVAAVRGVLEPAHQPKSISVEY